MALWAMPTPHHQCPMPSAKEPVPVVRPSRRGFRDLRVNVDSEDDFLGEFSATLTNADRDGRDSGNAHQLRLHCGKQGHEAFGLGFALGVRPHAGLCSACN